MLEPFIVWEADIVDRPVQLSPSGRWTDNNVQGDLTHHDGIVYVGSPDEYVYAFVAATGERLWRFNAGAGVKSGIAIDKDGETIFFGTDNNGFFAVNTDDGTEAWHWEDDDNRADDFLSKPTIYEDLVIAGSAGGRVFAWEHGDDRLEWVYPCIEDIAGCPSDGQEVGEFAHAGIVSNQEFHIGNENGTVYVRGGNNGGYRARTLEPHEQPYQIEQGCVDRDRQNEPECNPEKVLTEIVEHKDGLVFGNYANQLYLWPNPGLIKWVYEGQRDILGDIAVKDNLIIFAEKGGTIVAIDTENKQRLRTNRDEDEDFDRMSAEWKESTEQDKEVVAGPVIHDDMVYWIDREGILYGYTAQNGREKFQMQLWDNECRRCTAKPVVHGSLIFVATADGFLKAIRLPD